MEHLRCVVERITYQNPQNGFTVLQCRAKGYVDLVTVVGSMPRVFAGSVLTVEGFWKVDAKYGRQFSVHSFEETLPATVLGMEKFLGGGLIKGIGPALAKRIVQTFGKETLNVIEEDIGRLSEVDGIGKTRVERIRQSWEEQREVKNIMLFLQQHDVSTAHITKIYKAYGSESIPLVKENPYRLADDIWGIGFKTADTIAKKLGFAHEAYERLRSGLLYTLNQLANEGHCYATRQMLLEEGETLLEVEVSPLAKALEEMVKAGDVITEELSPEEADKLVPLPSRRGKAAGKVNVTSPKEQENPNDPTGQNSPTGPTGQNGSTGPARQGDEATQSDPSSQPAPNAQTTPPDNASSSSTLPEAFLSQAAIYLPPFFHAEVGTVKRLLAIYKNQEGLQLKEQGLLEAIQTQTGLSYDQVQLEAIQTAIHSKVLLLTGGPGTGKTTTTLGILLAFQAAGARILLAAPTGRAAKRLSEATGMEAMTIHRLLDYKPPEGYQKNEEKPLEGEVLILDECSMIDILLMYNLLKAIPDPMRVILVGDVDQLPSVGAGNVLRDLIDSGCFPVVRLTRIFRQAQTSRIIMNAHRINEGKLPDISNPAHTDFFFLDMERRVIKKGLDPGDNEVLAQEAVSTVCRYVKDKLPEHFKVKPQDIQVLVPMQRSLVGASNLNQVLQQHLNPMGPSLKRGGVTYRSGDKVMQIRNNYEKEVFNGDIGVVSSVDEVDKTLTVLFDNRQVSFEQSELDELVLAYATTIHKSQGSEYPIVVMPLTMNHFVMLQRNLLYTGVTRAKKILLLVGTRRAVSYAVKNVTVTNRNTRLALRLQKRLPPYQEQSSPSREVAMAQPSPYSLPTDVIQRVAETPLSYGSQGQDKAIFPPPPQQQDKTISPSQPQQQDKSLAPSQPQQQDRSLVPPKPKPTREEWMNSLFARLQGSTFRSRFHLKEADFVYIQQKGLSQLREHAEQIVKKRLAPMEPKNDGKQTPMKGAPQGHPVFLAQHATATCCRGCLEKWHHIPKGKELSPKTQAYVVDVIMHWIGQEMGKSNPGGEKETDLKDECKQGIEPGNVQRNEQGNETSQKGK